MAEPKVVFFIYKAWPYHEVLFSSCQRSPKYWEIGLVIGIFPLNFGWVIISLFLLLVKLSLLLYVY